MKCVLLSQRVDISPHGERRDALDQRWAQFLRACNLIPIPVPNSGQWVTELLNLPKLAGIILTGGNDLPSCGGDVPERDITEQLLLEIAIQRKLPVLGVCHGMQVIQAYFGQQLSVVSGHIAAEQTINIDEVPTLVNSYHNYGTTETQAPLQAWAHADDGVIKAVRHSSSAITGIMWHPERIEPWAVRDIALVKQIFGVV